MPRKKAERCWDGCGRAVTEGRHFKNGHVAAAVYAVIFVEYGGPLEFLRAHGYGPDAAHKSAVKERDAMIRRQRHLEKQPVGNQRRLRRVV